MENKKIIFKVIKYLLFSIFLLAVIYIFGRIGTVSVIEAAHKAEVRINNDDIAKKNSLFVISFCNTLDEENSDELKKAREGSDIIIVNSYKENKNSLFEDFSFVKGVGYKICFYPLIYEKSEEMCIYSRFAPSLNSCLTVLSDNTDSLGFLNGLSQYLKAVYPCDNGHTVCVYLCCALNKQKDEALCESLLCILADMEDECEKGNATIFFGENEYIYDINELDKIIPSDLELNIKFDAQSGCFCAANDCIEYIGTDAGKYITDFIFTLFPEK